MAARLNRRHTESVLKRIKASQLVNRLQDHALGKTEMTATQIKAAEVVLKKVLADQKAVEHSGEIIRKAPQEMTLEELDERIARLAAREESAPAGNAKPPGVH